MLCPHPLPVLLSGSQELELEEFRALESQIKADVVGLDVGAARAGSASGGSEQRQQQQRKVRPQAYGGRSYAVLAPHPNADGQVG